VHGEGLMLPLVAVQVVLREGFLRVVSSGDAYILWLS
jgi:hypothetical protein